MIFIVIALAVILVVVIRRWSDTRGKLDQALRDLATIDDANTYAEKTRNKADSDAAKIFQRAEQARAETKNLRDEKKELEQELKTLTLSNLVQMVRVDAYDGLTSDEVKNKLALLKGRQEELIKSGGALKITGSSGSKKEDEAQKKQILRCFNAESSNIVESVTVKNVDASRAKIQRAYDAINKIFQLDGVQLSSDYLSLKFEELSLVYAYMVKEAEEREQRRAIREQMVEEEKVRREIEREKQKIEREEAQFAGEVKKLMAYMQKSKDDVERQLYIDKINELEGKLKSLDADKANVLQREQNTRAGFVYVISNIGSFGEKIYKIGMTRRLEPMDRIDELSSASVPFSFDVHALIFSEDAPSLETILHQTFRDYQVNKVNPRKEFFRVDLDEVKSIVSQNYNNTVKWIDIPDACEYRETLRMQEPVTV